MSTENNERHRLDLSGMREDAISEASIIKIEEIIQQADIKPNEISLIGLSAKRTLTGGLEITLLVRNGTRSDLEIKQLPLNIFDAKNDLAAQGTFQFGDYLIYANTSKPLTIVFPKDGIMKDSMDLTTWTVQEAK